jgi:hypothetical protein
LLVGFLFTRQIKGLVKPKDETSKMPTEQTTAARSTTPQLTIEEVSATAKNLSKQCNIKRDICT